MTNSERHQPDKSISDTARFTSEYKLTEEIIPHLSELTQLDSAHSLARLVSRYRDFRALFDTGLPDTDAMEAPSPEGINFLKTIHIKDKDWESFAEAAVQIEFVAKRFNSIEQAAERWKKKESFDQFFGQRVQEKFESYRKEVMLQGAETLVRKSAIGMNPETLLSSHDCSSEIELFEAIYLSRDHTVYQKLAIFKRFADLGFSTNSDASIEYKARASSELSNLYLQNEYLDRSFATAFKQDAQACVTERATALQSEPIYLKPYRGSASLGVMRLHYADDILHIETAYPLSDDFFFQTDPNVFAVLSGDLNNPIVDSVEETTSKFELDQSFYVTFYYRGVRYSTRIETFSPTDDEPFAAYVDKHSETGIDPFRWTIASKFLQGFDIRIKEKNNYEVPLQPDQLEEFLFGLEAYYLGINSPLYMEKEIQSPNIDGASFEIRVINIGPNGQNAKPVASYAKVGAKSTSFSGIAVGGKGMQTEQALKKAFEAILPEASPSSIDSKVAAFIESMSTLAEECIVEASRYFNEYHQEHGASIPLIPFENICVDSATTDFRAALVYDAKGIPNLKPVIIDFNLCYDYKGLATADPTRYQYVTRELHRKHQAILATVLL